MIQANYQFLPSWSTENTTQIKILAHYFGYWPTDSKLVLVVMDSKLSMENKRSWIANIILKENKSEGLNYPTYKTYYKATVIKRVWMNRQDK